MPRQHLTPGKDPVQTVQETAWTSGPVWTSAENLAPPGFDPRTVQPVAQSLYRLSYPAHHTWIRKLKLNCLTFKFCVPKIQTCTSLQHLCSLAKALRSSKTGSKERWLPCDSYIMHTSSDFLTYRGAEKSLAQPGWKQATATQDFEFHISYL